MNTRLPSPHFRRDGTLDGDHTLTLRATRVGGGFSRRGRSVNILVHSCSDATSRELRRIPYVFELPGYAQDAWGGLVRVSECLYK